MVALNPIPVYSAEAANAIANAVGRTDDNTRVHQFAAGMLTEGHTHQPHSPLIGRLYTLLDADSQAYTEVLKRLNNALDHPETLEKANAFIETAFAITCLSLDELLDFTADLRAKDIDRTFEAALVAQDSYLYRTFFECSNVYHLIRAAAIRMHSDFSGEEEFVMCPYESALWIFNRKNHQLPSKDEVFARHTPPYYQEGTVQYKWRSLYNEFCNRIHAYIDENALNQADPRFMKWARPENAPEDFKQSPGPQPT